MVTDLQSTSSPILRLLSSLSPLTVRKSRERESGNKARVLAAIWCCSLALSTSNCGTGRACVREREMQ